MFGSLMYRSITKFLRFKQYTEMRSQYKHCACQQRLTYISNFKYFHWAFAIFAVIKCLSGKANRFVVSEISVIQTIAL